MSTESAFKKFDVVVVGNPGIDTNVYLSTDTPSFDGETEFTENLDYLAHAAGFSARGFARLGLRTALIGYIGDDHQGHFIRRELISDGIDTEALFVDPSGTARSVNFVFSDGRRKNFYDGKGHLELMPDLDLCRSVLNGARLALFSIPNWGRHLLPMARELGLTIACDLQDIESSDDPYRQDFIDYSDILFFSAASHGNPDELIKAFQKRNRDQIFIAGLGSAGCALGTKEGIQYFQAIQLEQPVVDSNGAGDSLAVGLLSSYVFDSYSLEDAITRGQIAARYACTLRATSDGLIDREKLDQLSNENLVGF